METKRTLWQVISVLPAVIVGLVAAVFPDFAFLLLFAAVAFLILAIIAWAYVSIQELKKDNAQLRKQLVERPIPAPVLEQRLPEPAPQQFSSTPFIALPPPPPPTPGWTLLEEIDLLLDGSWVHTRTFPLTSLSTVRTIVAGRNRFVIHLADQISTEGPRKKWRFHSIESSAETMKLTRSWSIPQNGNYTFVLKPVGYAAFHVSVRVEEMERWRITP